MLDTGPATHVGANLCEDDQGSALFHALNDRQVAPCQAIERGAGITARFVRFCMTTGFWGSWLAGTFVRTGAEVRLEALIAHGQLLVIELIQCDGLL